MSRRPARTRGVRALMVLGLAALVTLLGLVPTAHPAQAAPGDLTVEITRVTPTVLRPGDELVIAGTITNASEATVTDPVVRMRMQLHTPSSRVALDRWLDGSSSLNVAVLTAEQLGSDVAAGATVPFRIAIPPDRSPFSAGSAWGSRGIEVQVVGDDVFETTRGLVLWASDDADLAAPTELSVLVPFTPTAQEWEDAHADGVPVAEAAAPRLRPVLDATEATPVSWALDPALLEPVDAAAEAADRGADEPTDEPTSEPSPSTETTEAPPATPDPSGTPSGETPPTDEPTDGEPAAPRADDLVSALTAGAASRDVVALAYGDADAPTATRERGGPVAEVAAARAASLFETRGIAPLDDVVWPAVADRDTVTGLAAAGAQAVVLPADDLPTTGDLTYTPSGRTQLEVGSHDLQAVLWDAGLSSALTEPDRTAAEQTQYLLAQTAVIARERPGDSRGLLAVLPRDVDADTATRLAATLDGVREAPWLDVTNLRSLLGRTDGEESRAPLPESVPGADRLSGAELDSVAADLHDLTAFAGVTEEPSVWLDSLEPPLLSTLSTSLLQHSAVRDAIRTDASARIAGLREMIRVETGSSVLLINESGDLPITIESTLPVDATVDVRLVPGDPRLRADEAVTATIPANGTTTVRVPVTAVANGNVLVDARVLSEDGDPVGAPASFTIRVRADWESTGTAVAAALLAAGFVVGLVRTIRKGRRFTPDGGASSAGASPSETAQDRT